METERLPLGYWLSLVRRDIRYYGKRRRWAALVRSLKATIVDHDNVERCNECGRRYPSWIAPDALYEQVHGSPHGQLCIGCFDAAAAARGHGLVWTPRPFDSMDDLRQVCDEVGAFR